MLTGGPAADKGERRHAAGEEANLLASRRDPGYTETREVPMKLRAVVCGLSVAASLGTAAPSGAGVSLGIFLTTLPKESIEALFGATRRHAILQYVLEWYNSAAAAHTAAMQARAEAGAVPMCVWGTGGHDKGYGFDSIISGTHDAYIRDVAGSGSAFNKPVIIAFCPEFNHRSSPYYYLNDPSRSTAKYAEMWRHVHGIFREAGATNAQWAFCPNYQGDPVTDAQTCTTITTRAMRTWTGSGRSASTPTGLPAAPRAFRSTTSSAASSGTRRPDTRTSRSS